MKYRVKYINNNLSVLTWILAPALSLWFAGVTPDKYESWAIQCKKHWWNRWKNIHEYDNKECAYLDLLQYETDNLCSLTKQMKFPHNKYKGQYVWCELRMGKINPLNKDYNEGNHYYAGYKPKNYAKFYYCSYGKSYEAAIGKLWQDLEIQRLLHNLD